MIRNSVIVLHSPLSLITIIITECCMRIFHRMLSKLQFVPEWVQIKDSLSFKETGIYALFMMNSAFEF